MKYRLVEMIYYGWIAISCALPGCSDTETASQLLQESASKTSTQHKLVSLLETYNKATRDGDVETYRKLFASKRIARVDKVMAESGSSLTAESIRGPQSSLTDSTKWTVTHFRERGNHARLQFIPEDSTVLDIQTKTDEVAVVIAVFRKEQSGWKFWGITVQAVSVSELNADRAWPENAIPQMIRDAIEYEAFKES